MKAKAQAKLSAAATLQAHRARAATIIQAHLRGTLVRLAEIRAEDAVRLNLAPLDDAIAEMEAAEAELESEAPPGVDPEVHRANAKTKVLKKYQEAQRLQDEAQMAGHDLSALGFACAKGDIDEVRRRLDKGASPNGGGLTPHLSVACGLGHLEVARLLLERRADVQSSMLGQSVLGTVCQEGVHMDVARLLLSKGADPITAVDSGMDTPLSSAARSGHVSFVEMLLTHIFSQGESFSTLSAAASRQFTLALLVACQQKQPACARLLLAAGAPPDANLEGVGVNSILCSACGLGSLECATLLLDHGANIEVNGPAGSPLIGACQQGHADVTRMLLSRGANVNATRWDGLSAMLLACAASGDPRLPPRADGEPRQHMECVKLCSAYGASRLMPRIGATPEQGGSRAMWEAYEVTDDSKILKFLTTSEVWMPLHHIEQLDRARADELLRNGEGVHVPATTANEPGAYVTPFMRALELKAKRGTPPETRAVALHIIAAGGPWSIATHRLKPKATRLRAAEILRAGYSIAESCTPNATRALIDVWRKHVMPEVLSEEVCVGMVVCLNYEADPDADKRPLTGCLAVVKYASFGNSDEYSVRVLGRTDGVHLDPAPASAFDSHVKSLLYATSAQRHRSTSMMMELRSPYCAQSLCYLLRVKRDPLDEIRDSEATEPNQPGGRARARARPTGRPG